MPDIDLTHPHTGDRKDAKAAAGRVAQDLKDRLDAEARWDGDTLHFERTGADGRLDVRDDDVHLLINLGFMLKPFKGKIRKQASALLEEHFPQKA